MVPGRTDSGRTTPRRWQPVLLALFALALLATPAAQADDDEGRVFKEHNTKWTLPDGWNFEDLSESEKGAGFFAAAQHTRISGRVLAYRRPDNGLSPQDFTQEIAKAAAAEAPEETVAKGYPGSLSGKRAQIVAVDGKRGGSTVHVRLYLTHHDGHFYILWIRAFHDHHKKYAKEIDAVRRGFRMIQGGGGEEKPDRFADPSKDPAAAGTGEMEPGEMPPEQEWREEWPKREGSKLTWTDHNVSWTLPEQSPYRLRSITDASGTGLMLLLLREDERSKRPKNEESVEKNETRVLLAIEERGEGYFAKDQIEDAGWQGNAAGSLGTMLPGSARVETTELEIDGVPAARFTVEAKNKHGDFTAGMWTFVSLRDRVFIFRITTAGDRNYWSQVRESATKLLDGVSFSEKVEPIFGPVLGANPTHNAERGASKNRERELRAPGAVLMKPKGMSMLVQVDRVPGCRWAVEQRSDDGKHYFYMHLAAFTAEDLRRMNKQAEDLIQDRADAWSASAGEAATFKSSRGQIKTRGGRFGRAKGDKYEMTTVHHGAPFVEEGYFVKWKQNFYHIVIQYGGEGAQKVFKDLVKDLQKRMDFLK